MKLKFRKIGFLLTVLSLATTVSIVSCNKEDEETHSLNILSAKNNTNIPYFSSSEELENAIYVATSFDTISDLIDFEQEQNRSSIGAISDLFYDNIELETFSSENDVLVFYDKHKDVLDTIINNNEVSVLPKFSNTPYRYVANADGIFSVGNMYYKLFKTGTVSTTNKFIDELLKITDEDLDELDTTIFRYIPDVEKNIDTKECITKWKQSNNPTSSKDRIHITLVTNTQYWAYIGDVAVTRVKVYNLHKWAGVWWTSRHNLSCRGTVKLHVKNESCSEWEYIDRSFEKHQKANTMWIGIYEQPCYWMCVNGWDILFNRYNKYYHYDGFSIDAWYPGHDVEHFSK